MLRILHQTLMVACCLGASLFLAWKAMEPVNYGYTFWYDQLQIAPHIRKFGAQNRQGKSGFETTDRAQHEALFEAIGRSVNNGGEGLRTLRYRADGAAADTVLLTDAEATHLEDVANLIDLMVPVGWVALGGLALLLVPALFAGFAVPGLRTSVLTLAAVALVVAVIILALGPHEVFKALHEAVFPDDNQWFFYYQDSLMTTLMKAPDIFFAIGAVWALLAALIFLLLTTALRLASRYFPAKAN